MANILLVDDDTAFTTALSRFIDKHDHSAVSADSVSAALEALNRVAPDVLLLDLMLPDGSGLEVLEKVQADGPKQIIIATGQRGIKRLIGDVAGDRVRYLTKPIEPGDVLAILNSIESAAQDAIGPERHFGMIIGESPRIHEVYKQIERVATMNATVLIQGESGTGKELIAASLHQQSGRPGKYVPVNCGALNADLVGSQLFGHEKGSFTGASQRHIGVFERADKGTLFLDEVTEMPIEMQTQLLRVIETSRITRVGAQSEIDVDVRLIAATNRDPLEAIEQGQLREDLYFRLQVFPIKLPPLRERGSDVVLLAESFLAELNAEHDSRRTFSPEALDRFLSHDWPGNVRELRHVVQRAYIMADTDTVDAPDQFIEDVPNSVEGISAGRTIADVEKDLILATLAANNNNRKAAAASLGVSLKTLYNRLKEYESDEAKDL